MKRFLEDSAFLLIGFAVGAIVKEAQNVFVQLEVMNKHADLCFGLMKEWQIESLKKLLKEEQGEV